MSRLRVPSLLFVVGLAMPWRALAGPNSETVLTLHLVPADLVPADLEPADLEPADLEPADLEPADLEPACPPSNSARICSEATTAGELAPARY